MVISRTEYEFLNGAHQRLDKLEELFANLEAQSATHTDILRAILEPLPPAAGHHFLSHLGSSSERLHRLAEDVKFSAHGRHPTVYPFISYCFYFTFIFIVFLFFFPYYFCVLFSETK
jgi:hypothetical protein